MYDWFVSILMRVLLMYVVLVGGTDPTRVYVFNDVYCFGRWDRPYRVGMFSDVCRRVDPIDRINTLMMQTVDFNIMYDWCLY